MRSALLLLFMVGCLDMSKVDQAAHDEAGDILHTIHVECAGRWFGEVPCRIYRQDFSPVDLCCTIEKSEFEFREADANLETARRSKWKISGLKRLCKMAKDRCEYYEKMKAALEEGYVIIPNMDLDIFAIRTTKTNPKGGIEVGRYRDRHSGHDFIQDTNRPALGEGENVSDVPTVDKGTILIPDDNGKDVRHCQTWPEDFGEIDFPFKLAKPQILDATATALALKVFDRVGVSPSRHTHKGDPMVIGQIVYRGNGSVWQEKVVSFLVTWWLRESDLTV